eukprot:7880670-Alexandrium_andersonii.AAC.1
MPLSASASLSHAPPGSPHSGPALSTSRALLPPPTTVVLDTTVQAWDFKSDAEHMCSRPSSQLVPDAQEQ